MFETIIILNSEINMLSLNFIEITLVIGDNFIVKVKKGKIMQLKMKACDELKRGLWIWKSGVRGLAGKVWRVKPPITVVEKL